MGGALAERPCFWRDNMSGICSKHQYHDPDCDLCNTSGKEFLTRQFSKEVYERAVRAAEDAGLYVCHRCEFKYYLTIDTCPLCGKRAKLE